MRRAVRILVVAGPIAAIGWGWLWHQGKGELDAWLDAEIARLAEAGVAIDYATREVGGFPFGYTAALEGVRIRNRITGARYSLPRLSGAADITDPTAITTRFPEDFTASLPVAPALRGRYPFLPERLDMRIRSKALEVVTAGLAGGTQRLALRADSVLITDAGDAPSFGFALDLGRVEAEVVLPGPEAEAGLSGSARIGRLDSTLRSAGAAADQDLDLAAEDLSLAAESDLARPGAVAALIAGAPVGSGQADLTAARLGFGFASRGDADTPDGRVSLETGGVSARLAIAEGRMTSRAAIETITGGVRPDDPEHPIRGGLDARRFEAAYLTPLGPSEEMQPLSLRFALAGLSPDAGLWRLIDAERTLPREAGRVVFDIDATVRYTKDPRAVRPGEAVPLEVSNLMINEALVKALGARAKAAGQVEFVQPVYQPTGSIDIQIEGGLTLLRRLRAAGLISEHSLQRLAMAAAAYTRPGQGQDALVAEIAMDGGEIRVNGDPLR